MIAFVLRRLLQSLLVILVVALVAFGLFRYVGDPINNMVGQDTSEVDRAALRQRLGLDDPVSSATPPTASSASPSARAARSRP